MKNKKNAIKNKIWFRESNRLSLIYREELSELLNGKLNLVFGAKKKKKFWSSRDPREAYAG